jgi:hypothetical protein
VESSLYGPVKAYLEALGYEAKGEVCGCDVVALKDGEPVRVVIAELKLGFNLELVLQAVERSASCDELWLAVPLSRKGRGREGDARVRKLCRFIGVGLLTVSPTGLCEVVVAPEPWTPRRNNKKRSRLVVEHRKRRGDPALGGSTRAPIMTAYRQQALAVAGLLALAPSRPRDVKQRCPDAPKILQNNVYGWFERIDRGVYALTDTGRAALERWPGISASAAPAAPVEQRAR